MGKRGSDKSSACRATTSDVGDNCTPKPRASLPDGAPSGTQRSGSILINSPQRGIGRVMKDFFEQRRQRRFPLGKADGRIGRVPQSGREHVRKKVHTRLVRDAV